MSAASPPPATLVSVSGMLRVVPPPPPRPPSPPQLLTQKQVRELRRLCRKTANRAEFDSRPIQLRQIASIAAMASPSFLYFDPQNPSSGATLRQWVEFHRAQGADWKDERPLPQDAIQELRSWDRLLKAWARVRFESPISGSPSVERRVTQPPAVSSSPVTPSRTQLDARNVNEVTFTMKGDAFGNVDGIHEVPVPLNMSPVPKTPIRASPHGTQPSSMGVSPSRYGIGGTPPFANSDRADAIRRIPRERVTGGALLGVSSPIRATGGYDNSVAMVQGAMDSVSGLGGGLARTPVKRNEGKLGLGPIGTPVRRSDNTGICAHGAIGGPAGVSSSQVSRSLATMCVANEEHRGSGQNNPDTAPMLTPAGTPVRETYASRVARGAREGLGGRLKMDGSPEGFDRIGGEVNSGLNQRGSEIGISRVGDTINITVPTVLMSNMRVQEGRESEASGRYVARGDQENIYPPVMKRASHLHAVNTAKSWRKDKGVEPNGEYGISGDKEASFRNAAKNLVSYSAKENGGAGGVSVDGSMRSDMDWGKLRRPALQLMPLSSSQFNQSLQKNSQ